MTRRTWVWGLLTSPLAVLGTVFVVFGAGEANVPNTFVAGTTAQAAQVNANFTALADQITANVPWRSRIDYNAKASGLTSPTVLAWVSLRTLGTFTKHRGDTDVVLNLDTDLWVNGNSAQFQLRVDGLPETAVNGGMLVRLVSGVAPATDAASAKAVFRGLSAGTHTVSLWVRSLDGGNVGVAENDLAVDRTVYIEESPSR
jgi:hypothetical protein